MQAISLAFFFCVRLHLRLPFPEYHSSAHFPSCAQFLPYHSISVWSNSHTAVSLHTTSRTCLFAPPFVHVATYAPLHAQTFSSVRTAAAQRRRRPVQRFRFLTRSLRLHRAFSHSQPPMNTRAPLLAPSFSCATLVMRASSHTLHSYSAPLCTRVPYSAHHLFLVHYLCTPPLVCAASRAYCLSHTLPLTHTALHIHCSSHALLPTYTASHTRCFSQSAASHTRCISHKVPFTRTTFPTQRHLTRTSLLSACRFSCTPLTHALLFPLIFPTAPLLMEAARHARRFSSAASRAHCISYRIIFAPPLVSAISPAPCFTRVASRPSYFLCAVFYCTFIFTILRNTYCAPFLLGIASLTYRCG